VGLSGIHLGGYSEVATVDSFKDVENIQKMGAYQRAAKSHKATEMITLNSLFFFFDISFSLRTTD